MTVVRDGETYYGRVVVAAALSELAKKPLDGDTLRLDRIVVAEDGKKFTFVFGQNQYEFDFATSKLKSLGTAPAGGGPTSPEAIERGVQALALTLAELDQVIRNNGEITSGF